MQRKICIFSDIHGNGPAFAAGYPLIVEEQADLYVYLGDLCGYYYDQVEIYQMLLSIPRLICVRGNHDDMFLRISSGDHQLAQDYRKRFGLSADLLLAKMNTIFMTWLSKLPDHVILNDYNIFICHGSPKNFLDGYVYPDSPLDEFLVDPFETFLIGHTHYPMIRRIGSKLIINPGSIGQPRNGGDPTFATVVLPEREIKLHRFHYDRSALIDRINTLRDPNPYLKRVLRERNEVS
jgi:predicted phosphodiesterase